jgi:hypothetical protein
MGTEIKYLAKVIYFKDGLKKARLYLIYDLEKPKIDIVNNEQVTLPNIVIKGRKRAYREINGWFHRKSIPSDLWRSMPPKFAAKEDLTEYIKASSGLFD